MTPAGNTHSHEKRKDSLETRAVYIEICMLILKFAERPKTPRVIFKRYGLL